MESFPRRTLARLLVLALAALPLGCGSWGEIAPRDAAARHHERAQATNLGHALVGGAWTVTGSVLVLDDRAESRAAGWALLGVGVAQAAIGLASWLARDGDDVTLDARLERLPRQTVAAELAELESRRTVRTWLLVAEVTATLGAVAALLGGVQIHDDTATGLGAGALTGAVGIFTLDLVSDQADRAYYEALERWDHYQDALERWRRRVDPPGAP